MNRFPHIAAGEGLAEGPGQKAADLPVQVVRTTVRLLGWKHIRPSLCEKVCAETQQMPESAGRAVRTTLSLSGGSYPD